MEMAYKIMSMVLCYKTTGSAKLDSEKQLMTFSFNKMLVSNKLKFL